MSEPPPSTRTDWTSPSASRDLRLPSGPWPSSLRPSASTTPTEATRGDRSRGLRAYPVAVSTRMLIILALVCGLAILVAFAVQAAQLI